MHQSSNNVKGLQGLRSAAEQLPGEGSGIYIKREIGSLKRLKADTPAAAELLSPPYQTPQAILICTPASKNNPGQQYSCQIQSTNTNQHTDCFLNIRPDLAGASEEVSCGKYVP